MKLGNKFKLWVSLRLSRGRGVSGALAPKVRKDGRKLGGSLPTVVRGASIKPRDDGFTAKFHSLKGLSLEAFNAGRKKGGKFLQVPRPIIGMTPKEEEKAAKIVVDALVKRGKKMGIWK